MILELSDEAAEYGRQARRALEAAGGDDLLVAADAEPLRREHLGGPALTELGAWELEPYDDTDSLEAAAALCRAAGYWALPYPVAERLARIPGYDGLLVVADTNPSAAIGGLESNWAAVDLTGHCHEIGDIGEIRPGFVVDLELGPPAARLGVELAVALTLPCWTLLGMLDRAIELTVAHVQLRQQFGQPLAKFQGVQFQLTDAEVERSGLDMLAKYALWSITATPEDAVDDALALRAAAIEAAEVVFRVCHQLHGAAGFCDETTLSWLSRYSQPLRRLPLGLSATRDLLAARIGRRGLTGLYTP